MGGPDNSFNWKRSGTIIGNDSTIRLVTVDASHGGDYTCTVSNAAGSDSASTTLYVAPYIITPLENQTLTINGSDVIISCNATGFPIPSVSWVDSLGLEVSTTSLLQFNPISFGDEGVYDCMAKSVINQSPLNAIDEITLIGNYSAIATKTNVCIINYYFLYSFS